MTGHDREDESHFRCLQRSVARDPDGMSLNAPLFSVIPEDTERVAKVAFPTGNRYLQLRDTLGPLVFRP